MNNESIGTVLDTVSEQDLDALNELAARNEEQPSDVSLVDHSQAREAIRQVIGNGGPAHIGPFTPRRIADLIVSGNATRDNLTDKAFVSGIQALIRADVLGDVNMVVLGGYYATVIDIAKRDVEAFEDILCSLTENVLPADWQEPLRDKESGAIVMKDGMPVMEVHKAEPMQRLAHCLYIDTKPPLVSTIDGRGRSAAYRRVDNCLAAFKKQRATDESEIIKRLQERDAQLFPSLEDTPEGQERARIIAAEEEKAKALAKAAKAMLPRTPSKLYIALYRQCLSATIEQTNERRALVNTLFSQVGFNPEDIAKWHGEFLEGNKQREIEHWNAQTDSH